MLLDNSTDLLFCELLLLYLRCLRWKSRRVNKDKCILLSDIQHSQPHISVYWAVIFLSCSGNIWREIESLMIMLSSAYLDWVVPSYSGGIIMLLCSSLTDTFNNKFVTNCGTSWPSIFNLRQSLSIGDWKTWGCRRIHL